MPTYNSNDDKPTAKEENELRLETTKKFKYGNSEDIFCYDNELPVSETQLDPFKIYSFVTNGEWKNLLMTEDIKIMSIGYLMDGNL